MITAIFASETTHEAPISETKVALEIAFFQNGKKLPMGGAHLFAIVVPLT